MLGTLRDAMSQLKGTDFLEWHLGTVEGQWRCFWVRGREPVSAATNA